VTRLVCGATREDAQQIAFDEGPVFSSFRYLEERGEPLYEVCQRESARTVIEAYVFRGRIDSHRQGTRLSFDKR
jgi:hypothetical protein